MLAKANQALATLDKFRARLDQVSTRLTALEFEGGDHAPRRAHGAPARRAGDAHGGRDRALHRRARQRGAADRDAARGDDGRRRGREVGARRATTSPATPTRRFALALEEIGRLAHQDLLDFGRLAELLGYDRKLNTLDYPVSPRGYRVLGRIPRLPEAGRREHRRRVRRAGRAARRQRRGARGGRGGRRDPGEGHPRGPAPAAGDQPRGPLPADLDQRRPPGAPRPKEDTIPVRDTDEAVLTTRTSGRRARWSTSSSSSVTTSSTRTTGRAR